jgi:hypothetical protein
MKKLLTVTTMLFVCIFMNAQAPQGLNYQAVARTADGVIIPTQNIGVRFSILDGSVNGTVVYSETHTVVTNSYGLFTLAIGKGTPVTSTFPAINWASGTDKFLKVEIAPAGGSNYQLQGTTQLLSVPYALYSEKTRLLAGNNTINITNGNTITGNYQAANNTILLTGNAIAGNYQAANNTVLLSGNTIAGNYQAGNNTILLNGNTITGNYQPANNTILLNGNTIAGNYQAGTGINLTGNTISHNLVAGTGINIAGNVITNTGTNQWLPHANGIYYPASGSPGNIAVRTTPAAAIAFISNGNIPGVLEGNAALFTSSSPWHTSLIMLDSSGGANNQYTFSLGGNANTEVGLRNFGIMNHNIVKWAFLVNGATNNIGIGMNNVTNAEQPKSKLHVFNGDVNIDQIGSGIIMKSPNGQCWRVTIDNTGNLVRTAITCPN